MNLIESESATQNSTSFTMPIDTMTCLQHAFETRTANRFAAGDLHRKGKSQVQDRAQQDDLKADERYECQLGPFFVVL